jgi:hypothetical protein
MSLSGGLGSITMQGMVTEMKDLQLRTLARWRFWTATIYSAPTRLKTAMIQMIERKSRSI